VTTTRSRRAAPSGPRSRSVPVLIGRPPPSASRRRARSRRSTARRRRTGARVRRTDPGLLKRPPRGQPRPRIALARCYATGLGVPKDMDKHQPPEGRRRTKRQRLLQELQAASEAARRRPGPSRPRLHEDRGAGRADGRRRRTGGRRRPDPGGTGSPALEMVCVRYVASLASPAAVSPDLVIVVRDPASERASRGHMGPGAFRRSHHEPGALGRGGRRGRRASRQPKLRGSPRRGGRRAAEPGRSFWPAMSCSDRARSDGRAPRAAPTSTARSRRRRSTERARTLEDDTRAARGRALTAPVPALVQPAKTWGTRSLRPTPTASFGECRCSSGSVSEALPAFGLALGRIRNVDSDRVRVGTSGSQARGRRPVRLAHRAGQQRHSRTRPSGSAGASVCLHVLRRLHECRERRR